MAKFEKGKFINIGNDKSSSSTPSHYSDERLDEIIEKIKSGNHSDALESLNKFIEPENNENPLYYYWRGVCKHGIIEDEIENINIKEECKKAIVDFSKSIQLQEDDPYAFFWRGKCFYYSEEYKKAIADFNKSIELGEDEDAADYHFRGICRYNLTNYESAIDDFNKALELKEDENSFYWRGLCKYHMKDYENAIDDFNKALELK